MNRLRFIIPLIISLLWSLEVSFAVVEGVLPGKMRIYFYKGGTGSENGGVNFLSASLGDTLTIDVFITNFQSEQVTGLSIYLTVDDRYFNIVPQGKNLKKGSIRPFRKGNYMVPAGNPDPFDPVGNWMHGDSLSARDNSIDGWQLDYVQISSPDIGFGRPISMLRYGTACTFQLIAKAPCDSATIRLDSDNFHDRITAYNILGANDSFSFRAFQTCYITVLKAVIDPPLPDLVMQPGSTNSTIDLDNHIQLSSIPDSLLSWTAKGNSKIGVTIDPKTHIVTFEAPSNFKGYEDVTFTVTNAAGIVRASDTLRILVDYAPALKKTDGIPSKISIHEDSLEYIMNLRSIVEDKDDTFENLLWFIRTGANLTHTVVSDSLSLKGKQDYFGAESLKLSVYDAFGLGDSLTVPVEVLPVNDPPKLSGLPDITFVRGDFYKLNLANYSVDVDGDPLSVTWKQPENLIVSVKDFLATITTDIFIGSEELIFTVTDPSGLAASDTLSVTVKSASKPPVWTRIPKIGFPQGHADSTLFIWDYVTDPDDSDEILSFVFTGRDDIDSVFVNRTTGRLTMYDLNNTPGWDRIMVTAFDPDGNSASTNFLAFIGPVDGTPIAGGIPDTTMVAGTETEWIDLDDFYYDVDNTDTQMRWTWGRLASADSVVSVSINPLSHRVNLKSIGTDKYGFDRIFFTVTDPTDKFADDICIITVVKDLSKPILALPFKVGFQSGEKTTLDLDDYVEDLIYDRKDLTWSWSLNQKTTISLDKPDAINSRPVTFSGSSDWIGWEYVAFKVTNPLSGAAQDTVLVFSVSHDGSPLAGGLRPFSLKAGECVTVELENYSYDSDTPSYDLTWSVSGNDSISVSINSITRFATVCAPSVTWEGQENITFKVTDKQNHSSSMAVLVTVTDAVVRNVFSVMIIRNPMQEDYMDFYITSKQDMTGSPSVKVKIGQDSTSVSVETIAHNYYYGKYLLPLEKSLGVKSTANILVSATTKDGKAVQDTTRFAYGRVDAGGARIALGPVALTVPPGALAKPALITVAPGAESPGEDSDQSSGEVMFSGIPYVIGPSLLSTGKPLTIEFTIPGKSIGPGIYERSGDNWRFIGAQRAGEMITAGVYGGGTFRLGYDATPPRVVLHDSDDETIRITAMDYGSGIDEESITVLLDGNELPFSYDPEQSVVSIDRGAISGNGSAFLELTVSDRSGNRKVERFAAESHSLPDIISLEQNHPNPFNPVTHITFENTTEQVIRLEVYDLLGRKVRLIVRDRLPAGRHTYTWDARDDSGRVVSSGTYLYCIISNSRTITKKMLLLR